MTVTQIITAARNRYNAVSDSFWSDSELIQELYDACLDMARESLVIERTYSTSAVASQQDYAYPGDTIAIKRVTYNGKKLRPISFREDDSITGLNQSTTATGTPQYYAIWNETLSLRPIPSGTDTIKVWSYNEPAALTATSTLEIPTQFHMDLVNYILAQMGAKDSNFTAAQFYSLKWSAAKLAAKRWSARKKRSDGFAAVQDEDAMIEGPLGAV